MTLIVSLKAAWLKQLCVVGDWPMAGLPKTLHLDGAAEFKSKALKRSCGQYGVELVYRRRRHHGSHIERRIGTKMGKLKSLPGATGGSPKARRAYDPDKPASSQRTWRLPAQRVHDLPLGRLLVTPSAHLQRLASGFTHPVSVPTRSTTAPVLAQRAIGDG